MPLYSKTDLSSILCLELKGHEYMKNEQARMLEVFRLK